MITLFASTTSPQIRATITTSQEQLGRLLIALADFDTGSVRLVVEVVGERDDGGGPFRKEKTAAAIDDYDVRYRIVEDFSGECG